MLSKPDYKQKQILFVQVSRHKQLEFKFSNDNFIIKSEGKISSKSSLHKLLAVFIVGDFTMTSNLLRHCQEHGIAVFLLKRNLEVYAQLEPYAQGNFLLRSQQYHLSEGQELSIAQHIVENKIYNQLSLLKKYLSTSTIKQTKSKTKKDIYDATEYKSLLGIEGTVAKLYFATLFEEYEWTGRKPRAKYDINNLLLDIGYTYLFNLTDSLLRLYGFDTYKGVYHKLFFQRKSLACDIMEPFRPVIDHALVKAWNLNRINPDDFTFSAVSYTLPWKNQKHYSKIFLEELFRYKLDMYDYIKGYYRYMMNDTENEFPYFNLTIR